MNRKIIEKYIKDKPLTYKSEDGSVEVYGTLNMELFVKRLLESKYITGHNERSKNNEES